MLDKVIGSSWVRILQKEFESEYLQKLSKWLQFQRESGIKNIYPASEDVFKALKLCPYGQVKIVIIGQDPYYQKDVADGLAFSYKGGIQHLPGKQSLDVILDEIEHDIYQGFNVNRDYDLTYLAKQGVLLLNTCLTVFQDKPGSHRDLGWEKFTSKVIESQLQEPSPKVFMVWGNDAKTIMKQYVGNVYYRHLFLFAPHPASDLHNRDSFGNIIGTYPERFTGCKHFSQVNAFLLKNELSPINWFPIQEPFYNPDLSFNGEPIGKEGYPKSWDLLFDKPINDVFRNSSKVIFLDENNLPQT
jgi:uracil-DNA glycosylase